MKIITKKPIIVDNDNIFSNIDGNSTKEEILTLQKLINSKGEKLVDETGVFDAKTIEVYNKYKTRLDRELLEMGYEPIKLKTKAVQSVSTNSVMNELVPQVFKNALKNPTTPEKESWWKQRTKTQKTLIIGGGAVGVMLLGFLIYKAVKK